MPSTAPKTDPHKIADICSEVRECGTLDELYALDETVQDSGVELAGRYRAAFDAAERKLRDGGDRPLEEFSREELLELARQSKIELTTRPSVKTTKTSTFHVDTSVQFWPMPPQARALAAGIVQAVNDLGRDRISLDELKGLAERLRNEGSLGGTQPPDRILKYYMSEKNLGFVVRGLLVRL